MGIQSPLATARGYRTWRAGSAGALLVVALAGLAACTHLPARRASAAELVPALERLVVDTAAAAPQAPAAWLHVQAPRLPLTWRGSAGPAATVATLRAAGYEPARITSRMLLQHTGGLRDVVTTNVFLDRVIAAPTHRWSRAEQLALAMSDGPPLAAPGAAFHCSDTGYILLGELIETLTCQPLLRSLAGLLDNRRLDLVHTWFKSLEPEPADAPPRAVQMIDDTDAALPDASIDLFGGGGLVSNHDELGRFYRAVVRGEVLRQPGTAETMLAASPQSLMNGGAGYGMGIARLEHAGVVCHGHGGFWGTDVWHGPAIDVTVAGAVTSTRSRAALRARAMTVQAIGLAAQASLVR